MDLRISLGSPVIVIGWPPGIGSIPVSAEPPSPSPTVRGMAERFSPEWIAALDEATQGLGGATGTLVIQQVVTGADGERAWHLMLTPEAIRVRPGRADAPDVTFAQDRATADAIADGELSAGAALTAGRLIVRGATARLIEHREVLARIDEALARA